MGDMIETGIVKRDASSASKSSLLRCLLRIALSAAAKKRSSPLATKTARK